MTEPTADQTPEPDVADQRPAPRCLHLRTKRDYILAEPDDEAADAAGYYYCLHTFTVIGPDDDVVGPHVCVPGRTCYESSGF